METSRQIELAAADWIARRDSGDWSSADQAALDSWIAQAIAHRVAFIRLDAAWQQSDRLKVLGAGQQAGAVPDQGGWAHSHFFSSQGSQERPAADRKARVESSDVVVEIRHMEINRPQRKEPRRLLGFVAVAATLVLAVSLALGFRAWTAVDQASYATAMGAMKTVPLADGSRATLSSDSKLDIVLSRGERNIDLKQGEVFFKVAKDAGRPFVVNVGTRKVIAVGTQFAVRRDAAGLRVVVTEGTVRLESGPNMHGPDSVLLSAGAVAVAGSTGLSVQSGSVESAESYLSWRNGFLVFADTPLKDAVAEFNRYSTTKIVIADPNVAAMRVGGSFRSANAEGFVRLLEMGFSVRADRRGDQIVLTSQ